MWASACQLLETNLQLRLCEVGMSTIDEVRFNRAHAEAARCAAEAAGWESTLARADAAIARLVAVLKVRMAFFCVAMMSFSFARTLSACNS